jgi:hypothetical protein
MALSYRSVFPQVVNIRLDNGLNPAEFLDQIPQGAPLTYLYISLLPSTADVQMVYGQQSGKRVFQGQVFSFGGSAECPNAMDRGVSFGCDPVAGGILQIEYSLLPGVAATVSGQ